MVDILEKEQRKCFDFFWNEVSLKEETYGLIRDNTLNKNMCSIASLGFGLPAIAIGIERGYITREQGEERVLKTLLTMKEKPERVHGFYYHFLHMDTANRYGKCEVSIIDTAIFLMGALTVGEYFGGEIARLAEEIYVDVDWQWYHNPQKNQFYMGYNELQNGHFGAWDHYAEQFMIYFLSIAAPNYPVKPSVFYDCPQYCNNYKDSGLIYHSHGGGLFVYQFSHAFIDFRGRKDRRGIDWFENSVRATKANHQYCIDNPLGLKTYGENAWGMTACETPTGYTGAMGALPCFGNEQIFPDGTIPPCGAIGSIVFTPEESIAAMKFFAQNEKLWGKYGFIDAYNLDVSPEWYSNMVIGIDKGISILMIENYRSGLIWNLMNQNKYIQKAFELLEFTR